MGKGLINGHNMLLTTINSVMARGVRFLLGFRVYPFLRKTGPGIPVFGHCPFFFFQNSQKFRVFVRKSCITRRRVGYLCELLTAPTEVSGMVNTRVNTPGTLLYVPYRTQPCNNSIPPVRSIPPPLWTLPSKYFPKPH